MSDTWMRAATSRFEGIVFLVMAVVWVIGQLAARSARQRRGAPPGAPPRPDRGPGAPLPPRPADSPEAELRDFLEQLAGRRARPAAVPPPVPGTPVPAAPAAARPAARRAEPVARDDRPGPRAPRPSRARTAEAPPVAAGEHFDAKSPALARQRRLSAGAALSSMRMPTVALPAGNVGALRRFAIGTGRAASSIGFRPDLHTRGALRRAVVYRTLLEPPRAHRLATGMPS